MGIDPKVRQALREMYIGAWSLEPPDFNDPDMKRCNPTRPVLEIRDAMQDVRGLPDFIETVDQLIYYVVDKVVDLLILENKIDHHIVCVDRIVTMMKRLVCYEERYKDKEVYSEEDGPFLPKKGSGNLPDEWEKFAGNRKLMQRELFPRLFNAFLNLCKPKRGQSVTLHGFPGRSLDVIDHQKPAWERSFVGQRNMRRVVIHWNVETELPITKELEEEDPDLYNRIYTIKGTNPYGTNPEIYEWEAAKNDIGEGDLAMFYYDHFFKDHDQIICINDGDAIPIALLYAHERKDGRSWRNDQWLKLKRRKANDIFVDKKPYEYVNVNKLYDAIYNDPQFKEAGVQNPVATLVFMIVLGKTDFVKNQFFQLGVKNVLWKTLLSKLKMFSHMIQLSTAVTPDTRVPRRVVIDEYAFSCFLGYCYTQKHGNATRTKEKFKRNKKAKKDKSLPKFIDPPEEELKKTWPALLKNKTHFKSNGEPQPDERWHYPGKNTVRRWCRHILWNMLYWINGMRGTQYEPNVFEEYRGHPYFGFMREPESDKAIVAPCVCAKQKPVDPCYKENFIEKRLKKINKKRKRKEEGREKN